MTKEDQLFLERIGAYAEKVMSDIDANPEKTKISTQLEKLRPVMEEIATEENTSLEDVFIRYMDLASTAGAKRQEDFNRDYMDFDDLKI